MVAGFGGISGPGMSGVKGQPFSADIVEESDQYLVDGNHIHHETHGRIFRDSEGRSRTENELGGLIGSGKPIVHIQIFDPADGAVIMLDPEHKVASVVHFGGKVTVTSTVKPVPRAIKPAQRVPSESRAVSPEAMQQNLRDTRDMQVLGAKRQYSQEDLGTMEIEGFTVKGTRTTTTTPAGAAGNDKPLTSYYEHWFSADLQTDLLTKSTSPESGQHVHRLVNIRSGDPDPLLFQVPADYTVKEQQQ